MSCFHFKHFDIRHDRSTMKVGTDGVLLGAWADVERASRILDIGCGSGLVAIMAAQRSRAFVEAVEIDAPSAEQARENARRSPFAARVSVTCCDIRDFQPAEKFDCVLSNPPYFEEDLLPPDPKRAAARHTGALSFKELISEACRLMSGGGAFHVVLPSSARERFVSLCREAGLHLSRRTDVTTLPGKPPKRALLSFCKGAKADPPETEHFLLCNKDNTRSDQYSALTRDFYL